MRRKRQLWMSHNCLCDLSNICVLCIVRKLSGRPSLYHRGKSRGRFLKDWLWFVAKSGKGTQILQIQVLFLIISSSFPCAYFSIFYGRVKVFYYFKCCIGNRGAWKNILSCYNIGMLTIMLSNVHTFSLDTWRGRQYWASIFCRKLMK